MKFDQFTVAKERLSFVPKGTTCSVLGIKFKNSFIYTTPKPSIFSFAINTNNESRQLSPQETATKFFAYSAFKEEQKKVYLEWLANHDNWKFDNPSIDKYVSIFVKLYYLGLEYRVIVEQRDHHEILKELLLLFRIYGGKISSNLAEDMGNLLVYILMKVNNIPDKIYQELNDFITENSEKISVINKNSNTINMLLTASKKSFDVGHLEMILPEQSKVWQSKEHFALAKFAYGKMIKIVPEEERLSKSEKIFNFSANQKVEVPYPFYQGVVAKASIPKFSNRVTYLINTVIKDLADVKLLTCADYIGEKGLDEYASIPYAIRAQIPKPPLAGFQNRAPKYMSIKELLKTLEIKNMGDDPLSIETSEAISTYFRAHNLNIEPDALMTGRRYNQNQYIVIYGGDGLSPNLKYARDEIKLSEYFIYVHSVLYLFLKLAMNINMKSISIESIKSCFEVIINEPSYKLSTSETFRLSLLASFAKYEGSFASYEAIVSTLKKHSSKAHSVYALYMIILSYVLFTPDLSYMPYKFYVELKSIIHAFEDELDDEAIDGLIDSIVARFKPIGVFAEDFVIEKTQAEADEKDKAKSNSRNANYDMRARAKTLIDNIKKSISSLSSKSNS